MKKAVVFLKGGFGNQLFQLSFANYLKENDFEVSLNTDLLKDKNIKTKRSLVIPLSFHDFEEESIFNKLIFNLFLRLNSSNLFSKTPLKSFIGDYRYTKSIENLDSESKLFFNGYWKQIYIAQSSKTFVLEVLKNFPEIEKNLHVDNKQDKILIHVRRRDFVDNGWELKVSYYTDSLKLFKQQYSSKPFDIFTDDPEWVSNQEIFKNASNIFSQSNSNLEKSEFETNKETIDTFSKMINYKHYIVGNSTYAFWAAFLGSDETSFVTIPDPWFINHDHTTLKLPYWHSIENRN